MPASTRKVRIVCISDTHNAAPGEGYTLPAGDILVHAGDLTNQGSLPEIHKAASWLEKADYAVKVAVAGNHDLSLDEQYALKYESGWTVEPQEGQTCRELLRRSETIKYLEHETADVSLGDSAGSIRIFGSPKTPDRGKQNWAFQYTDDEAAETWESIQAATDVIVTHGPPAGLCDRSTHWEQGGCLHLASAVRRVKPLIHICGHCHEGRGVEVVRWGDGLTSDEVVYRWTDPGVGKTKQSLVDLTGAKGGHAVIPGLETAVINCSIMARSWGRGGKAFNKPIVVDIILPIQGELPTAEP